MSGRDPLRAARGCFLWGPLSGVVLWALLIMAGFAIAGGLETGGWSL